MPLLLSLLWVGCVFAALAAWSWGKWTDAHIDFGAELYIPWRITEGDVLYRDIAYRHGPLSHYVNAGFFALFGPSLRTLVLCNLVLLALLCGVVLAIFRRAFGRVVATFLCSVFLAIFGFSQYAGISNFNYVTPYLHAQTHGFLLALLAVALVLRAGDGRAATGFAALAGLCLGGVLLTKSEIAAPAIGAVAFGLGLQALGRERGGWRRFGPAAACALAALVPGAIFFGYLRTEMPAEAAWAGVLGNWRVIGTGLLADPYYRAGAGLGDVGGNALRMLRVFAGWAAYGAAALAIDWGLRNRRVPAWAPVIAGAALLAFYVARPAALPWDAWPRALPLATVMVAGVAILACIRSRHDRARLRRLAPIALCSILAVGLLVKMLFNARFSHYGFVLAMPATLLCIGCAVAWIPDRLRRAYGGGAWFRAAMVAATVALVIFQLRASNRHYAVKDFAFGRGDDAMWVENPRVQTRGRDLSAALALLEATMPADATLLVLPDGVGLNFWLKRRNPSRYTLFLPTELRDLGGEARILADLRREPPDFIALVHRNHEEFGVGPFGRDPRNGRRILAWVEANYRRIERFGAEPFQGRGFGVVLLRYRGDAAASPEGARR